MKRPWAPRLRALGRDPILHFTLAGALLFAVDRWRHKAPDDARTIVVSPAFVEGLRGEHRARTGAPPTPAEEREMIARFVEEEAMVREALSLGLDRGDVIVRRRLLQKMEFLLLSGDSAAPELGEKDLEAYLAAHADRYREPARASFVHAFFSNDLRGASIEKDAGEALAALRKGADAGTLGDAYPRGREQRARSEGEIAAELGPAFARSVMQLLPLGWEGPIRSSYGLHLVRVSERRDPRLPALAEVRARVEQDARDERKEEALRAARRRLVERYRVEAPGR